MTLDLASQQRNLLSLITGRSAPKDYSDAYLQALAHSPHLAMVQRVSAFWRAYGVTQSCPMTSALLIEMGRFNESLQALIITRAVSPYIEVLGEQYHEMLSFDSDPLVAAVAQFERALIQAKRHAHKIDRVIDFPRDPQTLLARFINKQPLLSCDTSHIFQCQVRVSSDLPDLFEVVGSTLADDWRASHCVGY